MVDKISYESEVLAHIHAKAMTAKNECFFVGFLEGILANNRLDETELEPLLGECEAICRLVGDDDAAEILAEASVGHEHTVKELFGLLQQIADVRSKNIDENCRRSSANRLLGFCAGINCDSVITTREAAALHQRLKEAHDLQDDPRIVALRHRLRDALEDEQIDGSESEDISLLITALVGDSYADTGVASSEAIPVLHDLDQISEEVFDGAHIVLTGGFVFGTRRQVAEKLEALGSTVQNSPSGKTDIVVIGSEGSPYYTHKHHGGKLAKALEMRGRGLAPRIYTEGQLREILE